MIILGALLAVNLIFLAYFITQLDWWAVAGAASTALVLTQMIRANLMVQKILNEELPPEDLK